MPGYKIPKTDITGYEYTIKFNGETVTIDPVDYELTCYNGVHQYHNLQSMYHDILSVLLWHNIDHPGFDLVEYGDNNYWSLYDFNGKRYRIWFYNDGTMYIQHIIDYNLIDDMMYSHTSCILDILTAIIHDHS